MSRRKRDNPTVSLFPFLSVLACIMGVLTLMISASALGELDRNENPETPTPKQSERLAELKHQMSLTSADLAGLEARKQAVGRIREQLNLAADELAKLRLTHAESSTQAKTSADAKKQLDEKIASLGRRTVELEAALAERMAQQRDLEAELSRRLEPPPDPTVKVRPHPIARELDPSFVECRADGIVLHESDEPKFVPAAEIKTSPQFLAVLDDVAQRPGGTVVFLIRSDGMSIYSAAREIAISKKCRHGKLPVEGQGEIDLSLVKREPAPVEPAAEPKPDEP